MTALSAFIASSAGTRGIGHTGIALTSMLHVSIHCVDQALQTSTQAAVKGKPGQERSQQRTVPFYILRRVVDVVVVAAPAHLQARRRVGRSSCEHMHGSDSRPGVRSTPHGMHAVRAATGATEQLAQRRGRAARAAPTAGADALWRLS